MGQSIVGTDNAELVAGIALVRYASVNKDACRAERHVFLENARMLYPSQWTPLIYCASSVIVSSSCSALITGTFAVRARWLRK